MRSGSGALSTWGTNLFYLYHVTPTGRSSNWTTSGISNSYTMDDFSRMDFPSLISYTCPFFNQGLHDGIYIFYSDFNRTKRNHGDPDQRPRSVASDLGLQCLFFLCPSTRTSNAYHRFLFK